MKLIIIMFFFSSPCWSSSEENNYDQKWTNADQGRRRQELRKDTQAEYGKVKKQPRLSDDVTYRNMDNSVYGNVDESIYANLWNKNLCKEFWKFTATAKQQKQGGCEAISIHPSILEGLLSDSQTV